VATLIGHAVVAVTAGYSYPVRMATRKFFILAVICAIIPDADVITFSFGIPYESPWGHRGMSHSILFAIGWGILVSFLFYRKEFFQKTGPAYIFLFVICTVSHGVMDALTNGGLGVEFFFPFNNTRYFFPWRPIQVSPFGFGIFTSIRGLKVLASEAIWIGLPCTFIMLIIRLIRKTKL
jgi:inner membrane protein